MTLDIRVGHQETFMSAKVSGSAAPADVHEMLDLLSDESMRMSARRILVDLRRVEENFEFPDHVAIGARAAANLGHLEKVATLVAAGRKRGTSEAAAQQRGVALRTFTSEDEAIGWLEAW
jgi:hypothetical protein